MYNSVPVQICRDPFLQSSLLVSGVGEDVEKVLTEQKVFSLRVFRAVKKEHLVRLLQCGGMPSGGHGSCVIFATNLRTLSRLRYPTPTRSQLLKPRPPKIVCRLLNGKLYLYNSR